MNSSNPLDDLLSNIRNCALCQENLPFGPRPVLRASASARILIVGQAPGARVHASGVPWDDASGERLRRWLDLDRELFYDESQIAIVPMGFCYPGRGKNGDLPPRPECAATWHPRLIPLLTSVRFTLLVGQYAQRHFLGDAAGSTLTETIADWRRYWPRYAVLPHPSPRNQLWLKRHPWFEQDCVPAIRERVHAVLAGAD
ncbi:uracil-DNA glycosylase family protein [Crenobacter cavernae]|uniref:Uracil-DNA glycosylase family protein n=1 Tax=Crenobacter cavernae TaxID=2290923 RepID=A0ABY0FHM5_9NEIS|nr:uracil-DNA glycosylase family protein [Crenobacter cavernae]